MGEGEGEGKEEEEVRRGLEEEELSVLYYYLSPAPKGRRRGMQMAQETNPLSVIPIHSLSVLQTLSRAGGVIHFL